MKETMIIDIDAEIEYEQRDDGKFICYFPMINMYFSASSKKEIQKKASAFVIMYCRFWKDYKMK